MSLDAQFILVRLQFNVLITADRASEYANLRKLRDSGAESKSPKMASHFDSHFWFDKERQSRRRVAFEKCSMLEAQHFLMLLQHFLFHFNNSLSLSVQLGLSLLSLRWAHSALNTQHVVGAMLLATCCRLIADSSRLRAELRAFSVFGIFVRSHELGLNCYQTLNDLQLSIELLPDKSCRRLPLLRGQQANANGILKTNNTTMNVQQQHQ